MLFEPACICRRAALLSVGWLSSLPLLAVGCTRSVPEGVDPQTAASTDVPASSDPAKEANPGAEPAVLRGRVVFQGKLPEARKIVATKDVEYCGKFDGEWREVVVSDSGGLAGAVVEIRGVDEPAGGWTWQHPAEGYVLRQKGCAFDPPLLVVPDGEELQVFNDDPVSHNVNTGQWNVLQASGQAEPLVRSVSGRRPARVGCNIHSWMESWLYFAQSPYFAVTDDDGSFRIPKVPPGKYRVTAWHPSLQFKRASVSLAAGAEVDEEIVFESPF